MTGGPAAEQTSERISEQISDQISEQVVAIDHVGVAVTDLDAAVRLYTGTFGLSLKLREDNEDQGVSEAMLTGLTAAGAEGTRLQLLAPLAPTSAIARFLERSGPGLQHLALRVRDVEAATRALRASGLEVLYPQARRGTADSMINFVHPRDAGGVLIELVQPADLVGDAQAGIEPGRAPTGHSVAG